MSTSRFREDQRQRNRSRAPERSGRYGETIARGYSGSQLQYGETIVGGYPGSQLQDTWRADRAPLATVGDQRRRIEQQHLANRRVQAREFVSAAREASRRAMNAMTKTVEIADGSADFRSLMVAAYGKGIMRYWECARAVFEDATGLRLIQETEKDEDL